jgi:hypothetical protein
VFSVQSVLRYYKQNNWSNELDVGQLPACKNTSTEAEDFFGIRHQALTGEDTQTEKIYDKKLKCEGGTASSGIMFVSSFVKAHVVSDT